MHTSAEDLEIIVATSTNIDHIIAKSGPFAGNITQAFKKSNTIVLWELFKSRHWLGRVRRGTVRAP